MGTENSKEYNNLQQSFKNPILFIHGFGGGKEEYQSIISYLKTLGSPKCYEFFYAQSLGEVSLRVIAEQLHVFIAEHIAEHELDIIGLSQGGVIARYYIKHFTDKKIRTCITICTPHQGSLLAHVGTRPGIKDLQPMSELLTDLDCDKADYYAVHNPLDLIVFPGWNARMDDAKENKCVWALTHPLTFSDRATLDFIQASLSQ